MGEKNLIFNADDFGFARSVNEGIVKAHVEGVVTSTSLMVTGREVMDAVERSLEHPRLAVGLHWDVWGEDERDFDLSDLRAVEREFHTQLDRFRQLMQRDPTHIDSHRHAHRHKHVFGTFRNLVEPLGIPLRDDGRVRFVGNFYAQWEWQVTELAYIGVPQLMEWLRDEVHEGWTEFSCHPAIVDDEWDAVYKHEREIELQTLIDPHIRAYIDELGIRLRSYADLASESS
ncbi:MAG: carbohydrate deacetylase [Actinomycetota bacterium]